MSHLLPVELHAKLEMFYGSLLLGSDGHWTTYEVVNTLQRGERGAHGRANEQLWPLLSPSSLPCPS